MVSCTKQRSKLRERGRTVQYTQREDQETGEGWGRRQLSNQNEPTRLSNESNHSTNPGASPKVPTVWAARH